MSSLKNYSNDVEDKINALNLKKLLYVLHFLRNYRQLLRQHYLDPCFIIQHVFIFHPKEWRDLNLKVVRVWVFWIWSSSPFPAIWLGRDVRGECSTKTMGIGNEIAAKWRKARGKKFPFSGVHRVTFGDSG